MSMVDAMVTITVVNDCGAGAGGGIALNGNSVTLSAMSSLNANGGSVIGGDVGGGGGGGGRILVQTNYISYPTNQSVFNVNGGRGTYQNYRSNGDSGTVTIRSQTPAPSAFPIALSGFAGILIMLRKRKYN